VTILPSKVNWWYESIVDWMLLNPHKTKKDAAAFFGVTKEWMYQLTNSDVFKTLFEERRKVHNGMVSSSVIEKTTALTEMAIDQLSERVASQGSVMTPGFLKSVTQMGLEALGYDGKGGGRPPSNPSPAGAPVQVNVITVSADALAEARERLVNRGKEIAAQPQAARVLPPAEPTTPLKAIIDIIGRED
jgi:hypothetical protein